jgi:biotin synthase-like enzyme
VPKVIRLDIVPAFVSKVSHRLAEILGTNWKPHCVYCPQSSRQVEKINRTLQDQKKKKKKSLKAAKMTQ